MTFSDFMVEKTADASYRQQQVVHNIMKEYGDMECEERYQRKVAEKVREDQERRTMRRLEENQRRVNRLVQEERMARLARQAQNNEFILPEDNNDNNNNDGRLRGRERLRRFRGHIDTGTQERRPCKELGREPNQCRARENCLYVDRVRKYCRAKGRAVHPDRPRGFIDRALFPCRKMEQAECEDMINLCLWRAQATGPKSTVRAHCRKRRGVRV